MATPFAPMAHSLSPEEKQAARRLWVSLMLAPSQAQLEAARVALKAAPVAVQRAVTTAIVALWSQGQSAESSENPFD